MKSLRRLSLSVPFFFLFSCSQKFFIVEDFAVSSYEAGHGRVESVLCGHYAVGDNICWLQNEDDLALSTLEIKTYLHGTVFITSDCGYEHTKTYTGSEPVKVNLSEVFDLRGPGDFCVIDYLVSPYFPFEKAMYQQVSSLTGRAYVFYLEPHKQLGLVRSRTESLDESDSRFYEGSGLVSIKQSELFDVNSGFFVENLHDEDAILRIAGCGFAQEVPLYAQERYLFVPLNQVVADGMEHCVIYGESLSINSDFRYAFAISIEIIDDNYIDLAEPSLKIKDGKLVYDNLDPVNWTIINDREARFLGSGEIALADDELKLVFLTSAGRSKVIKLKNGRKSWSR